MESPDKDGKKNSGPTLWEFITAHKILLGVLVPVFVAVAGVLAFLWNAQVKLAQAQVKLAQAQVQACEKENKRIRGRKDKVVSESSELELELGDVRSELANVEGEYRNLEIRCMPRSASCIIPVVALQYGTPRKGRPNQVQVELKNSEHAGSARLVCAARVINAEGQKSYWATNDVLPHRDGSHECTVFIGERPPGGGILPVVLKELKSGAIMTNKPLRRLGVDFEELCVMSRK